jgi:anti-anti-sigma regulatory factor
MGNEKNISGSKRVVASTLTLPSDFRMAELQTVQRNLLELLAHIPVALNAAKVERVDTAALQLLVAFHRDAVAHGMHPTWAGVSDVFRDAVALLGLTNALELPALPA